VLLAYDLIIPMMRVTALFTIDKLSMLLSSNFEQSLIKVSKPCLETNLFRAISFKAEMY
jgi:hypothetical protein